MAAPALFANKKTNKKKEKSSDANAEKPVPVLASASSSSSASASSKKSFSYSALFVFFILLLLHFLAVLFIAPSILYACKVAQSNILPTDIKCAPYQPVEATVSPVDININLYKNPSTGTKESQKIQFPYNEKNKKNKMIEVLSGLANSPKAYAFTAYIVNILLTLIAFNYSSVNVFLNILNEYLPEWFILLTGHYIVGGFVFVLFFLNIIYFLYLLFSQMKWLFMKNTNTSTESSSATTPNWKEMGFADDFFEYSLAWVLAIGIGCFAIFGLPIAGSVGGTIAFSIMAYISLSLLIGYDSLINGEKANYVLGGIVQYHKQIISLLFSILLVTGLYSSSYTSAGTVAAIVLIVLYILDSNGIPNIGFFKDSVAPGLSPLSSYKQAKKDCKNVVPNPFSGKNSGFFGNLGSSFGLGLGNMKLSNISKKITDFKNKKAPAPAPAPLPTKTNAKKTTTLAKKK
jgi:hypothetical protein